MRLEAAKQSGVAETAPNFHECLNCKSVAIFPLPTEAQLSSFYQNYHAVDAFLAKADKKVKRARRRIRALSLLTPGRRFLDVGASIGAAAEGARQLGFTATAIEIDEQAVEHGRRLYPKVDFHTGGFEALATDAVFDVLYMAEIIEHVTNPKRLIQQAKEKTAPGGIVFLTTPDAGHVRRPVNLMDWKSVKPPEHITLFTTKGLRALFSECGFSKVFFWPHAKPGVRLVAWRGASSADA